MLIIVTNKDLVKNDYLSQIEEIIKAKPSKIILREKQLNKSEYFNLSKKIISISNRYNVDLVIHNYIDIGKFFNINSIHLPFNKFNKNKDDLHEFDKVGVSVHSLKEAKIVGDSYADYIIVGHIFQTQTKKNLVPKGLKFLKEVKDSINIPIYAIGGINLKTINSVLETGVNGVAIMSDLMESNNPHEKVLEYKKILNNYKQDPNE
ncbi:MAG: thiamine phosphate synthase [Methanobrevibacter sp.]|jgi:thiamine-phosphate pyrophosphorylase|nr:thiamine phosphate synthase [Candidatus Methanovirga australis]